MSEPKAAYMHANALLIGETGLLVRGASGSGKSALTLRLVGWGKSNRSYARLIGDDRVALASRGGRLVARPHPAIAGLIEMRGVGLIRVDFEAAGVIRAVIDLAPPGGQGHPRHPLSDSGSTQICGVSLPRCAAEIRDSAVVEKIIHFIHYLNVK